MHKPLTPLIIDFDNPREAGRDTFELLESLTENEEALLMAGFKPASMHDPIDTHDPIAPP